MIAHTTSVEPELVTRAIQGDLLALAEELWKPLLAAVEEAGSEAGEKRVPPGASREELLQLALALSTYAAALDSGDVERHDVQRAENWFPDTVKAVHNAVKESAAGRRALNSTSEILLAAELFDSAIADGPMTSARFLDCWHECRQSAHALMNR